MRALTARHIHGSSPISHLANALICAENMVSQGISLPKDSWYQLIEKAIQEHDVSASRKIHLLLIGSARRNESDSVLDDRLIHAFARSKKLFEANLVFSHAKRVEIHAWNGILSAHEASKCHASVFRLFSELQCNGIRPNKLTYLCILKASGESLLPSAWIFLVHGHIMVAHFERDVVVENALLNAYMKCHSLPDAENVFERLCFKDVVSWNSMISGYAEHGQYVSAFHCFEKLYQKGIEPTNMTYSCILNVCGILGTLDEGRLIHHNLIQAGFCLDVILQNTLIDMYSKCGSLRDAYKAFTEVPQRDVISWSAIIAGCAQHGDDLLALELFVDMLTEGVMPDRVSYLNVLPACGHVGAIQEGMWIFDRVIRHSLDSDIVIRSALVDMFAKCGCILEAQQGFDRLQDQNLVSYNALIGGYAEQKEGARNALGLFEKMINDLVEPNKVTFLCTLKACGSLDTREQAYWIHDRVVREALESDSFIQAALIDMYMNLGCFRVAQRVFEMVLNPTLCLWNAIISGYAQHKHGFEAFEVFQGMHQKGPNPNEDTYTNIFKACTDLNAVLEGKLLHDQMIRDGVNFDVVMGNSLISMYMKFAHLEEAEKVFEQLSSKNEVSWNSMISGLCQHRFETSVIELFERLRQEKHIQPDKVAFLSMLKACSNVGAIVQGKITYDLLVKSGLENDLLIRCALVDLYVKADALYSARKLLPTQNVASWGAIISGCALRGSLMLVEECLEEMKREGLTPDEQIYTSILAACSHSGSVEKGYKYFNTMQTEHGFIPNVEHSNGMIDLLCRAGHLAEAKEMLCTMEGLPDLPGQMSLFTACRLYGNWELARYCFGEALDLEYDAMSNVLMDVS